MPWASSTANRGELVSAVGEIYAAVENAALWPAVLDRVAELVKSDNVVLFANYADSVANNIQAVARDSDTGIWKPYREHYAAVNVWTERSDQIFPSGAVRYSHQAISDAELKKTEFHADWLQPNGIGYGFGVEIILPDHPKALLSAFRSELQGPFEEQEGGVLQALLPHLQRALRLHCEITMLRSSSQGFERALDAFDRAVFGVSGKGDVLFCNQIARKLIAQADGLCIRNHRLVADLPAQNAELQFLLTQAAVAGSGFSGTGATAIERKSGKPALRLIFLPFAGNLLRYIPDLATLVFVYDPATKPLSSADTLRKLFRLSPAEARLADLLASGTNLAAASEHLKMTTETARFHLKSIFRKTGVNRQAQLVQLAHCLPGNTLSRS